MKKEDLLSLDIDNIAKARKSAVIGEERVWSGITYVKTATGWKPKGNPHQKKEEAPSTKRDPKIEDPSQQKGKKEDDPAKKVKKLEEYASKAKDSQLEAAIEDPNQNPEVKDVAQTELDRREKETQKGDLEALKDQLKELKELLTKDLDQTKEKKEALGEIKVIKKTGLMLGGHKIFIVMNEDNTGYKTQGMKALKLESKEGESLSDFKERIKQTWAAQQNGTETKQEEKPVDKQKEESQTPTQIQSKETSNKNGGLKEIKKTGIMVDGHKMFITMNTDKTGYVSKGFGLNLESKEGESLVDFKNRVKQTLTDKLSGKEQKKENDEVTEAVKDTVVDEEKREQKRNLTPTKERKEFLQRIKEKIKKYKEKDPDFMESFDESLVKDFTDLEQVDDFLKAYNGNIFERIDYFDKYRNKDIEYTEKEKTGLISKFQKEIDDFAKIFTNPKDATEFRQTVEETRKNAIKFLQKTNKSEGLNEVMSGVSGESSSPLLGEYNARLSDDAFYRARQLGIQQALVEQNKLPICLPIFYQKFKDTKYNCYDRALYTSDAIEEGEIIDKYIANAREHPASTSEEEALELYAGNSFYRFLVEYMFREGDIDKMNKEAKMRGESKFGSVEAAEKVAKKTIKDLNDYIDKNPIDENVILSRRVNTSHNEEIFAQMALMKKGDTGTFKSVQSFSYTQKEMFGNFQITLLAKKGDPIANAHNEWELEFISKQNTNFRVLETGYNSMVIELIPEKGK